ncbi:MAG TPA: hypothetical protein VIQ80_00555 [Candidatus Saccharimonadales bacterium]
MPDSVDRVECITLRTGTKYLIQQRPTIGEAIQKLVGVHDRGTRYVPKVTLKNGEVRHIVVGRVQEATNDRIAFTGMISNGNELAIVEVAFSGSTGGSLQITNIIGS